MTTQSRYLLNRYPWLASVVTNPASGDVFFVNGSSGNDTYDGTTPETAVLTITQAMDLCTAGADDYIIVLAYPSAGPATETWPIACDTANVHLIGANLFGASPGAWLDPPADTHGIVISANYVEIAGFEVRGGATKACITNDSNLVWRAHIHHNDFAFQSGAQDGILQTGLVDNPHWLIEYNKFGHLANITRDAIRIEYNSTRSIIRNNLFYVNSGCVGIHFQGLCTAIGYVMDNRFKVADAANGEAIYIENANAAVCQFHNNMVSSGNAAMANNPYRDLGANCHWSINYAGTAPTYPVTV